MDIAIWRLYERHCQGDDLCGEAQGKIESLTAQNAKLQTEVTKWKRYECGFTDCGWAAKGRELESQIAALTAQNEAYDRALERLADKKLFLPLIKVMTGLGPQINWVKEFDSRNEFAKSERQRISELQEKDDE